MKSTTMSTSGRSKSITTSIHTSAQSMDVDSQPKYPRINRLAPSTANCIAVSTEIRDVGDVVTGLVNQALGRCASDVHESGVLPSIEVNVDIGRGRCEVFDKAKSLDFDWFATFQDGADDGRDWNLLQRSNMGNGGDGFLLALGHLSHLVIHSGGFLPQPAGAAHSMKIKFGEVMMTQSDPSRIASCGGTRIAVTCLFDNMPVRARQRAALRRDKTALDRQWRDIVGRVVAVILARQVFNRLVLTELRLEIKLVLHPSAPLHVQTPVQGGSNPSRLDLVETTRVLLQSGLLVEPLPSTSWIRLHSANSTFEIQGIICSEPSLTRRVQFISSNGRPFDKTDYPELYNLVNDLFTSSDFELMSSSDSNMEHRGQTSIPDQKLDKMTGRSTTNKRGKRHWPQFCFQIQSSTNQSREGSTSASPALKGFVGDAVAQWLKQNNFRPRRIKIHHDRSEVNPLTDKRRGLVQRRKPCTPLDMLRLRSHIKIGSRTASRSNVHGPTSENTSTKALTISRVSSRRSYRSQSSKRLASNASLNHAVLNPSMLRQQITHDVVNDTNTNTQLYDSQEMPNEFGEWYDEASKQTFLINQRNGNVMSHEFQNGARLNVMTRVNKSMDSNIKSTHPLTKSKAFKDQGCSGDEKSKWMTGILEGWKNQVFSTTSNDASLNYEPLLESDGCCLDDTDYLHELTPAINKLEVSRQDLKRARFIAQVDRKFLLVVVPNRSLQAGDSSLVLIDQHAADERAKLERLFEQLCELPDEESMRRLSRMKLRNPSVAVAVLHEPVILQSSNASYDMIQRYAQTFAQWGIVMSFDSEHDIDSRQTTREQANTRAIQIHALPWCIAGRCMADPGLVLAALQSEAAFYEDRKYIYESNQNKVLSSSHSSSESDPLWVRKMSHCPRGISELLTSRACRSAVMFNDELTDAEASAIVGTLAKCQFPFQCAHGRPSLVPLLCFDTSKPNGQPVADARQQPGVIGFARNSCGSFVSAFRKWQQGGMQ